MAVAFPELPLFVGAQVGTPGPANMAMLAVGARYGFLAAMPFVAGVIVGKQLIIWPLGFGLLNLAEQAPLVFALFKYASAAYILWLAWKVANMRLNVVKDDVQVPGFVHGLIIHPLNPKAWAMITASFTNFVETGTSALQATIWVATCLFGVQLLLHPIWAFAGDKIAATVAGTPKERVLMVLLAVLTALSVFYVLFAEGRS